MRAPWTLLLVGTMGLGCEPALPEGAPSGASSEGVLATVNGRVITRADLTLRMQQGAHGVVLTAADEPKVLESIIRQELLAQAAESAQLDQDPGYQERLGKLRAELEALRRERLSELYLKRAAKEASVGTEDEARAYFEAHRARIGREVHVHQLLRKGRGALADVRKSLDSGRSFDQVLAELYPSLPPGVQAPWDLGFLRWSQVPEAWQPALEALKPGEVSGIISGPSDRHWIIRLVEERSREVRFEDERAHILDLLGAEKKQQLSATTEAVLRAQARIEYARPPAQE